MLGRQRGGFCKRVKYLRGGSVDNWATLSISLYFSCTMFCSVSSCLASSALLCTHLCLFCPSLLFSVLTLLLAQGVATFKWIGLSHSLTCQYLAGFHESLFLCFFGKKFTNPNLAIHTGLLLQKVAYSNFLYGKSFKIFLNENLKSGRNKVNPATASAVSWIIKKTNGNQSIFLIY